MSVSMEALQVARKEIFVLAQFVLGVSGLFVKLTPPQREVVAISSYMREYPMLQTGSWS
jgi:hypothetical protein